MTEMPRATHRKTKVGRVVSDRMDKTIVVAVERLARHRIYKRVVRVTSKFKAHDEANVARVGDRVLIEEWRPMSREKRWRLVDVVARAGRPVEIVAEEPETTEAISMVAHPGRRAKEEAAAAEGASGGAAAEAADGSAKVSAAGAMASADAVSGAGATGASGGAAGSEATPAAEAEDTRAAAPGKARK